MTTTEARTTPSHAPVRPRRAGDPKRVFVISALLVTPLAFAATLLLALPAGGANAASIALVPALFAAGFFGGLAWLAVVVERDERMGRTAAVTSQAWLPTPGTRAA